MIFIICGYDGHVHVEDQITIGLFDGSDLIHLGLFKFDEWNQVMCSRWLCSSEKIKVDILAPSLDEVWNTRLRLKENNSKGLNSLYI